MSSPSEPVENAEPPAQGPDTQYADIFAEQHYEVPRPPASKEFMPWHRPRKQYVRNRLWANEIRHLLNARQDDGERSLAYLGLPGSDFLDIRYFHDQFFAEGGAKLRFLGFDSSASPGSPYRDSHNVSYQEMRSLPGIHRNSEVLGDDIRRLAESNSVALKRAENLGPFDVINLDFCDHFGSDKPPVDTSIYNSIVQILRIQARCSRPWSILLTTRVSKEQVAPETLHKLAMRLDQLAQRCDGFLTEFAEKTGIESLTLDGLRAADGSRFVSALGIGLSAWLLALARTISCALTVKRLAVYRVWKESPWPDMMSVVLRFTPYSSITSDPTRLATVRYVTPDECEQALRVVQSMSRIDDVDERLRSNEALLEEMVEATMDLLRQARYDVSDYRMWCESEA